MFGTLRYEPLKDEIRFESESTTSQRAACDACRSRKQKCSGQKEGCDRCKNMSAKCVYSEANSGGPRRRGRHAPASRGDVQSGSSTTTKASSRNIKVAQGRPRKRSTDSERYAANGSIPVLTPDMSSSSTTVDSRCDSVADDSANFDHILQDILPDVASPSMGNLLESADFSIDNNVDKLTDFPNDLFPLWTDSGRDADSSVNSRPIQLTGRSEAIASNLYNHQMTEADILFAQPESDSDERNSHRSTNSAFLRSSPTGSTNPSALHFFQPEQKSAPPMPNDTSQRQTACRCLQSTLALLEELENRLSTNHLQSIDSILTCQKQTITHCTQMVDCSDCAARSNYMTLLGVVCDKLIASYEQVLVPSMAERVRQRDYGFDTLSQSGQTRSNMPRAGSQAVLGQSTKICAREATSRSDLVCPTSFGTYQIDGQSEQDAVIRALLALQLRQASSLLAHMQIIAEETSRPQQILALRIRRQRLARVIEQLKKF